MNLKIRNWWFVCVSFYLSMGGISVKAVSSSSSACYPQVKREEQSISEPVQIVNDASEFIDFAKVQKEQEEKLKQDISENEALLKKEAEEAWKNDLVKMVEDNVELD